jgi:hypothetical protein
VTDAPSLQQLTPLRPASEQELDAPFGFVIQFSIIFILATSSIRPEMVSVTSRHAACTIDASLGRSAHNGTIWTV